MKTYISFRHGLHLTLILLREKLPANLLIQDLTNSLQYDAKTILGVDLSIDRDILEEEDREKIYNFIDNLIENNQQLAMKMSEFQEFLNTLVLDDFFPTYHLRPLLSLDRKKNYSYNPIHKRNIISNLFFDFVKLYLFLSLNFNFRFIWSFFFRSYLVFEYYMIQFNSKFIYRVPINDFIIQCDYLRLGHGIVIRKNEKWEEPENNTESTYHSGQEFILEYTTDSTDSSKERNIFMADAIEKLDNIISILLLYKEGRFLHSGIHMFNPSFFEGIRLYNGGTFFSYFIPGIYPKYEINRGEVKDLVDFFKIYDILFNDGNRDSKEVFTIIRIALRRLKKSIEEIDIEDKIIDLMIAAESLFSESNQELAFKLALRVSCLLGNNYDERAIIFKFMKEMYGVRSKTVHGNALEKGIKVNHKNIGLDVASIYLERIIRTCIINYLDLASQYKNRDRIMSVIESKYLGDTETPLITQRKFTKHLSHNFILKSLL